MKIEITETIQQVKEIDVDLPYYYRQVLDDDYSRNIIYGKIDETYHVTIHEKRSFFDQHSSYEIGYDEHLSIRTSGHSCYFKDEYKSIEKEYLGAKGRTLQFFKKL